MHGDYHEVCTNHPGLSEKKETMSLLRHGEGRFRPVAVRPGGGAPKRLIVFKILPRQINIRQTPLDAKAKPHRAFFRLYTFDVSRNM